MRAPDDHDTNEEIIYMLQKENGSLRSQLEEAQEKLRVAEVALTESRECLNGMVYSGPLQKSWMGRSRKSVQGSTVALQAIRSARE